MSGNEQNVDQQLIDTMYQFVETDSDPCLRRSGKSFRITLVAMMALSLGRKCVIILNSHSAADRWFHKIADRLTYDLGDFAQPHHSRRRIESKNGGVVSFGVADDKDRLRGLRFDLELRDVS